MLALSIMSTAFAADKGKVSRKKHAKKEKVCPKGCTDKNCPKTVCLTTANCICG